MAKKTGKLKVGVCFGGRSGEHEVSLRSAQAIIEAMDKSKYEVIPIAITKKGKWLAHVQPPQLAAHEEEIARNLGTKSSENNVSSNAVLLIGDNQEDYLAQFESSSEESSFESLDVVFPALHGTYGEDGTIQGLLETYNVPYVGCGVLASACGMDKVTMKQLFQAAELPVCRYTWFLRGAWEQDAESIMRRIKKEIGFPCFVKPANLGSSVGISKAINKKGLAMAINLAAKYDRKIVIEEGLDAREIECAVLGNDEPEASLPGEYVIHEPSAAFLDYTEKYSNTGHVEFVVPAPIPRLMQTRVQKMATTAFRAVDGAGLARVDFFLRRDTGELLVNELNTMPGCTDTSGYPKMWQASGLPFSKVIDRLIELALERHVDKQRNQTSI